MLGLFVNILNADDNYCRYNRENFPQQIQMQLSQKPKTFSAFFIGFLKSKSNFQCFEKKDECHSVSISQIIDSERGDYLNVYTALFPATFRQST